MPDRKVSSKAMSSQGQESQQAQGDPDNLAADALVYDTPPSDSALYELKDVEDSPVGGHQEQVLKDQ